IHTSLSGTDAMETEDSDVSLPDDLKVSLRATIARAIDYLCDVISCSPEQLRLPKSEEAIRKDEKLSRLTSKYYGAEDEDANVEYTLVLWNDEKHTISEVEDQVSRACKKPKEYAKLRAQETDYIGR